MRTRFGVFVCVALIALAVSGVAGASSSVSLGDGSAVEQYGETLPGAGGKVKPGTGKNTVTPLSPNSASSLYQLNPSARTALNDLATDSHRGAPAASLGVVTTPPAGSAQSSLGPSLLARLASPGAGSGNRLVVLLIAIVTVTIALGITAARRQRRLSRHPD